MPHDIAREVEKLAEELGVDRKRSIGEVAKELKVKPHIIRFWEENFPQIKPEIGIGNRRYYYNKQLKILKRIKKFLQEEGYTVAGLQKLLSKRKQDDYKEEDLDIILSQQDEKAENFAEELKKPEPEKIEIDDFIDPHIQIETGIAIDPKLKLMNFSNIKVLTIHPKIRENIRAKIKNIRATLHEAREKFEDRL